MANLCKCRDITFSDKFRAAGFVQRSVKGAGLVAVGRLQLAFGIATTVQFIFFLPVGNFRFADGCRPIACFRGIFAAYLFLTIN